MTLQGFDPLNPITTKIGKLKISHFGGSPREIFSMAKCALHVISGKAERVSTVTTPP